MVHAPRPRGAFPWDRRIHCSPAGICEMNDIGWHQPDSPRGRRPQLPYHATRSPRLDAGRLRMIVLMPYDRQARHRAPLHQRATLRRKNISLDRSARHLVLGNTPIRAVEVPATLDHAVRPKRPAFGSSGVGPAPRRSSSEACPDPAARDAGAGAGDASFTLRRPFSPPGPWPSATFRGVRPARAVVFVVTWPLPHSLNHC